MCGSRSGIELALAAQADPDFSDDFFEGDGSEDSAVAAPSLHVADDLDPRTVHVENSLYEKSFRGFRITHHDDVARGRPTEAVRPSVDDDVISERQGRVHAVVLDAEPAERERHGRNHLYFG